jgi:hypothetical protein
MRISLFVIAAAVAAGLIAPRIGVAESEVRDQYGKVIEIRTQTGNVTKAYDSRRNLIYTATRVGNQVVFRDPSGVIIGVGGPGTISDPRGMLEKLRPTHLTDY